MWNNRSPTLWMAESVQLLQQPRHHPSRQPWVEDWSGGAGGAVGTLFAGVNSHKTVYFLPITRISQWEVHRNVPRSILGDEFFLITPSKISVPILKHTLTNSRISTGKQGIFQRNDENLSTWISCICISWWLPPSPKNWYTRFQLYVKIKNSNWYLNKI